MLKKKTEKGKLFLEKLIKNKIIQLYKKEVLK
jgi:hypothetical protein